MASGGKKAGTQASRERLAQLKAQERRRSQRRTAIASVGVLALVGVFAWVVLLIIKSGHVDIYDSGELTVPTVADESGGILIGQDLTAGGEVPADALRVDLYEDPLCPVCRQFQDLNGDDLRALAQDGTIALYVHPISILDRASRGTRYPTRAASALWTVAEYQPAAFLPFFEALYVVQPAEDTPGLNNDDIAEVARAAGVSEGTIARFSEGEFTRYVAAATERASVDGLQGTPWITAAGQDFGGNVWGNAGQLSFTLGFIQANGVQAYLDAVEASQNPEPSPSVSVTAGA